MIVPAIAPISLKPSPPTAAYVHIPFCRRRCYYCDFPVAIVGDVPPLARRSGMETFGAIDEYVEYLVREIVATPPLGTPLQTLFFGGGTPSLLTPEQLHRLITVLADHLGWDASGECSMEIDPDTVTREKLQGYRGAGVNRISLGVQAFQLELLQACGRTHTPADIDRAIALLRELEIPNVSLDLISGLPHQTLEQWRESLHAAIALAPTHISVYDLTLEPQTAFHRWYVPGQAPLPSDDTTAEMYRLTQAILTQHSYHHYEISNYAQPGYACRHNRVYWQNQAYYGFGMGAASYVQGQRFTRPRKRSEYFQWVDALVQGDIAPRVPSLSPQDNFLETLMLGLRLAEGIDLRRLTETFGEPIVSVLLEMMQPFEAQGWAIVEGNHLQLTDPEGFLFSNVVLSTVFQRWDEPPRASQTVAHG